MKIILPMITSLSIVARKGTLSLIDLTDFPRSDGFLPVIRSEAALAKISSSSEVPLLSIFITSSGSEFRMRLKIPLSVPMKKCSLALTIR